MDARMYRTILRMVTVGISVLLWAISVYFSQNGFAIEVPDMAWIGWVLAVSVTVIEIVWNQEGFRHNTTITAVGIAAYGYGIWTNVVGILQSQGAAGDISGNEIQLIFPIILAVFLEITPEPLLMWALVGTNADDVLSHFFGGVKSTVRPMMNPGNRPIPMPHDIKMNRK